MKKNNSRQARIIRNSTFAKTIVDKPLVSVIMPIYNAGNFLVQAIKSIQNQTYKNWEMLIVDDGSTDNSWKILQKFAKQDKRIKIYRNKTNKGLATSLNLLLKKTQGKYIARMDADDISLPIRFSTQIAYLEKHPQIVACGGQVQVIDENGKITAQKHFPTDPKKCRQLIMNHMVIQPPVLLAKACIMKKCVYDNHYFKNDDISMHFKLLQYGEFGNCPKIIFQYRQLSDSLTHKFPKNIYFKALRVRLNAIIKYGFRPNILNLALTIPESIMVLMLPNKWIMKAFEKIRYEKTA